MISSQLRRITLDLIKPANLFDPNDFILTLKTYVHRACVSNPKEIYRANPLASSKV